MRCKSHLEDESCQLLFPSRFVCVGEDNCNHFRAEAERLCPSCGNKGASWSGWGKHGGFNYTCWSCEHTWTELLTWLKTPGVCLRCGKEFDNPVPEVTRPEGFHEIATSEWCAGCNALAMSVIFRGISAYRMKILSDPMRGGIHANT